ncbi:hypothetical protein BD289DRAFT_439377 [Coniella lustricola]|uniref:Uncharacterized protein n=1 Tax=Coniella lustricola TaxID=2025994 RepID=A0A2T3A1Q1_9PEZI|nr:hypothetical protein BD289DRAFT_439377 [Coniella lustricola]
MFGSGYRESTSKSQPSRSSGHHHKSKQYEKPQPSGSSSSKRSHSSTQQQQSYRQPSAPFSFLFVVSTLSLSDLYLQEADEDRWGILKTPQRAVHFDERATDAPWPVFRFQNGQVTKVRDEEGLLWVRSNGPGSHGCVIGPSAMGAQLPIMEEFATYTVLRGGHYRPIVFMANDATAVDVDEASLDTMYHALHFDSNNGPGVSTVRGRQGELHANGHGASWVGKLVPNSYHHPNPAVAEPSKGLTGLLPVILGLMAISQPQGRELDAFMHGHWRDREWNGPRWSFQYPEPGPKHPPRAVMVHVCCDSLYNPTMSTRDLIANFSEDQFIVTG